jgi:hypothetical protein
VIADYFNPAQFTTIVLTFTEHSFFFVLPINSFSAVGLSVGGLAASGLGWSLGPFLITYYLARKRD